jgi:hypothetical protein
VVAIREVTSLAARLDAPHDTGVAVLWDGTGWAIAVVNSATGDVLAWDGWHFEPRPNDEGDLRDLPWDEWDDMPSKLLHRANAPWLAGPLGYWLMPSYSVGANAGEVLRHHRHSASDADSDRRLRDAELCAYLPVVDGGVFRDASM